MHIDEAIKKLIDGPFILPGQYDLDWKEANRLGIAALKAMAVIQETHCPLAAYHKFGETKDLDMPKFKVGDLVRVKPKENVAPGYRLKVGHITRIDPKLRHPHLVSIEGRTTAFAGDELEKI